MPISKYVSFGNISDFDIDSNGYLINDTYDLPHGYNFEYTPLVDNHRYGIRIDYTQEEKDGYYSNHNQGLYISQYKESSRAKLDEKNLELVLKFKIKNN